MRIIGGRLIAFWTMLVSIVLLVCSAPVVAASTDLYMIKIQISERGNEIIAPRVVARVGQTAEVKTQGNDGESYRIDVTPEVAFTKNSSTTVALRIRILQRKSPDSEWILIASPGMMGSPSPSEPMELSTSIQGLDDVEVDLNVNVVPFDDAAEIGDTDRTKSSGEDQADGILGRISPTLMQKCGECAGGGTLCCANGCCEEPVHGCGWVCDP
ncbi:MAG: hypothetical protein KDI69_10735 [Xanthomonadales bacterium]|nr:hypothetical protein [Xanthomonadales bacterium]